MLDASDKNPFPPADLPSKTAWLLAVALSLATALAVISPFFWLGNASGHDFSFHAASWMDVAAQWRDGIFYPRWNQGANYGFGEPRFIFYPPLSWILGAALSFVVPWEYVPGVFIVLTQTLAGFFAFALAQRLVPRNSAWMAAVCYAANPYALLIVYMRSDFAEQLAMGFFPLLMLAALEVFGLLGTPGGPYGAAKASAGATVQLSILVAAVWLTNAPAAVVVTYTLGLLCLYAAYQSRSARPLYLGASTLALGFGLAGFYLIPAVYEQRWVNISQALASGLQPSQNFLYSVIADAEHNAFNHIASSTAVLLIALTAIFGAATLGWRRNSSGSRNQSVGKAFLLISAVAALLMLRVTNMLWTLLPELRFVQFPWRWMSILAVPFACFAGAAIPQRRGSGFPAAFSAAALLAVLAGAAAFMVRHTWWDTEDIPVLQEAIAKDEGFEGVDEYDPSGDDHSGLPEKSPKVALQAAGSEEGAPDIRAGARIHIERWSAEKKELRVTLRAPADLSMRLLNYPAWRVKVNDVDFIPQQVGETDQMILPLGAGSSHIEVRFIRTPDRTIGGVVSGGSVLLTLLIFAWGRRPRNAQVRAS
jgi:hypothetical protein